MKIKQPAVDYRNLTFKNLNTKEFCHLKLLFFWPVYGILFMFAERFYKVDYYYPMHSEIDNIIPFNELFLIPYMFWFVYLTGIHLYTLLYDTEEFERLMKFIIITYSAAIICYFIFPTCQQLRPVRFERDNILTRFMAAFYQFDTNTNVCPSIHVIGSLAVLISSWHAKGLDFIRLKTISFIICILICLSTVFLKQHSVIDIVAALPICFIAYLLCYKKCTPKN